jgi:hypothetical protein
MTVYTIDPLRDPRWPEFLLRHSGASIFHTPGWLQALHLTYGYEPVVYTTSGPRTDLTNGIAFCRVSCWLTGKRLVSLPFSDHCEPLADSRDNLEEIIATLQNDLEKQRWRHIQMRPRSSHRVAATGFTHSDKFFFHAVDLRPDMEELLHSFHKNTQRTLRRAMRDDVTTEEKHSATLLGTFYELFLMTRRRHQLPPQPLQWFRNVMNCLGDNATIHVSYKNGRPIAAIITLAYKGSVVYKYGCSDSRFHNLGGMTLLFWKTIQEAKRNGLVEFDLGRSDCDNSGLVTFKDHWGATRSTLIYLRYPALQPHVVDTRYGVHFAKRVFAHAPEGLLTLAGKVLYKHIG